MNTKAMKPITPIRTVDEYNDLQQAEEEREKQALEAFYQVHPDYRRMPKWVFWVFLALCIIGVAVGVLWPAP